MIQVDSVSVQFRMPKDKINGLKAYFVALMSRTLSYNEFWALRDVSFEVGRGEVMGIVGRNGAGKSTLLKVIAKILKPTTGGVTLQGNVVPMLELGSGFDYELSGKENIYLNGAILGYPEDYLRARYQEILEFSELHEFIDVPLRNYSSGMLMRLAFSVATAVNPEIMIVDEILSVGDEAFQKKSRRRMMELMRGGTTVLFVSHSLEQIREMCDRVVWLEQGRVRQVGGAQEVCDAYAASFNRAE